MDGFQDQGYQDLSGKAARPAGETDVTLTRDAY